MDKFQFQSQTSPMSQATNLRDSYNRARQNPRAFEEHVRQTNPQAYQRACQIRNSVVNPQEAVLQLAQQRGINPNVLRMLNL